MKSTRPLSIAALCGILWLVLAVLLCLVDVAPIGPAGSSVGLSHLNQAVFDLMGVHASWSRFTSILLVLTILTAVAFLAAGIVQLIRRKGLRKVDPEFRAAALLYLAVLLLSAVFGKLSINGRPILLPGDLQPEPSFPSKHAMIVCTVLGSTMLLLRRYVSCPLLCRVLQILCAATIALTLLGRLLAGVHWFTDILGGILVSLALIFLFAGVADKLKKD